MAFSGRGGLTAEFPFTSDTPSIIAAGGGASLGTSLLQLSTDFKHPQLGDGILIRLTLPLTLTAETISQLNLMETEAVAYDAD